MISVFLAANAVTLNNATNVKDATNNLEYLIKHLSLLHVFFVPKPTEPPLVAFRRENRPKHRLYASHDGTVPQ
jgi:hypothetical protein